VARTGATKGDGEEGFCKAAHEQLKGGADQIKLMIIGGIRS